MTEKEQFLNVLEREFPTTIKVLKAFPPQKADIKPHAKSRSAKDLAWNFVIEEKASAQALDGAIDLKRMPPAPASLQDVISTFEKEHRAFVERGRYARRSILPGIPPNGKKSFRSHEDTLSKYKN